MANGRIRFGKQSGGEVALVFPDGIDNTEVVFPESGDLVNKDYVDATLVGLGGLSVSDKTKLDGIEEQATKNKTDAFLLDRSNHTGSIPISVVENLEQVLANISTGGSGGLTPDELSRIEDIESDITKKADLDSSGKILTSQLPVIPTSLPDADSDGKLYGRKDGTWTEIVNTGGEVNLTYYYTKSETDLLIDTKQDTLVSGTSIKTINGESVLGSGDIVITGGGSGSSEPVSLAQTTGSGTDVIMSQKAVSDRIQYTNLNPVPIAIGGVEAGTTFNKTPIIDILNSLLYPYQNPSFGSFSIDGQSSGSFELGYTYPSGNKLFTWNIINPNNVKENSITLNAEAGISNTGSKSQMVASVTKNTAGSHTFTIKAQNSNNVEFSRTITFNWLAKRFWGVSEEESVDDDIIKSFSSELSNSKVKTVSYDGTGGKYPYFIYPTALGDLNNTKVNNLEWNDWVLVKRDFINVNGVSIPMNIYRGFNKINGSLTINWG